MYKIALLTYPFLQSYFEDAVKPLRDQCDIDVLPFEKLYMLLDLIPALIDQYDGLCVFSTSAEKFIKESSALLKKPVVFLGRHSVDFFKTFFIMLNNNRHIDFSRVLIDTTMIRPGSLQSLEDVVNKLSTFEETRINYTESLSLDEFYSIESRIGQNALDLWREGRFDILICRIADVAETMEKENVPYIFVYPEKQRVAESLESLVYRIRLDKQAEGLPASIIIFASGENQRDFLEISHESIRIQKALLEFSRNYASNFTVQFISHGFEVLTSYLTTQRITGDFTYCQLGYYLFSTLGITFRIGYGIGHDISSARHNALIAGKAAMDSGMSCVATENGQTIPLQARPSAVDAPGQDATISHLSNRTGLSPITLQRIDSALQFLGTNEVTNHELAEALQVTVANANRFLNSLIKSENAEILVTKKSTAKGRPSRIYRIQL